MSSNDLQLIFPLSKIDIKLLGFKLTILKMVEFE